MLFGSGPSHGQITASAMLASTGGNLSFGAVFGPAAEAQITNVYASVSGGAVIAASSFPTSLVVQTSELLTTSTTDMVIDLRGPTVNAVVSGSRIRCSATSSNEGLLLTSSQSNSLAAPGPHTVSFISTNSIETCTNGVYVNGPGQIVHLGTSTTLLSNTTGVKVTGGGKIAFYVVSAFTTNGTDIDVDGTTFTRAAFVALVPNSVIDLNYQSAVYLLP